MGLAQVARNTALPAALATAATTAAVTGLTKLNEGSGSAGINSVSHILWGDKAADQSDFSPKYTLVGGTLNSVAVSSWAAVHEMLIEKMNIARRPLPMLVTASLISGIAYVTDYHVVPERLRPGFEKKLTPRAMFAVYGVLALGLAVGALLTRSRD